MVLCKVSTEGNIFGGQLINLLSCSPMIIKIKVRVPYKLTRVLRTSRSKKLSDPFRDNLWCLNITSRSNIRFEEKDSTQSSETDESQKNQESILRESYQEV